MKKITLVLFILSLSLHSWAKDNSYQCLSSNDRTLSVLENEGVWKLDLLKKSKKVGGCELIVTSISDPASVHATKDVEFEVGKCQFEFDKFKSEFSVVNRGFIKINQGAKRAQALLLNNSQPLFCKKI